MRPRREPPSSGDPRAQLAAAPSLLFMSACLICAPARAEPVSRDVGLWTLSAEADADISLAVPDSNGAGRGALFDIALRGEAERFFQSGLRAGFEAGLRLQRDFGRSGLGLDGPAEGVFTGPAFDPDDPAGTRGDLETAGVFLRGGWGEIRAGRGDGAAAREAARPLLPFRLSRVDDAPTDLSGRNFISTRNTLTSRAAKLSVRSQRFFGVRAGASYTPEPEACGVDACTPDGATLEHGVEAAISFEHVFRGPDLRVEASADLASVQRAGQADPVSGAGLEDAWARSARLNLSRGGWSVGAAGLVSNDGADGGDYTALSAYAAREIGDWLAALEAGRAQSDLTGEESRAVQIGASRLLGERWIAGAGLSWTRREAPEIGGDEAWLGLVEIGLRF